MLDESLIDYLLDFWGQFYYFSLYDSNYGIEVLMGGLHTL